MRTSLRLLSVILSLALVSASNIDVSGQLLERSPQPLGVMPRALRGEKNEINFDSMPKCGRSQCLPYSPDSVGCVGKIMRDCYCANSDPISCAWYGCSTTEYGLVNQWLGTACLDVPYESAASIPSCAKSCIQMTSVRSSCSLKSWECFCEGELSDSCLDTCTDDDKETMQQWRDNACSGAGSGGDPAEPSVTTTISAKVTVATEGGEKVTSTIEPAQTTVVANSAANQNSINISTGNSGSAASGTFRVNIALSLIGTIFPAILFVRFWQ